MLEAMRSALSAHLADTLANTGVRLTGDGRRRLSGRGRRNTAQLDFSVTAAGEPDLQVANLTLVTGAGPEGEARLAISCDAVAAALPAWVSFPAWVSLYDESAKQWTATAAVEGIAP